MISVDSQNPEGITEGVANVLRDHLEAHGISCTPVGLPEKPNLIFTSHEGQKGDILLHGHMDTVPIGPPESWSHDPFASEIVDGRLYGRGSCDMKGPVAALAETLILYTEERHTKPLVVLATSDEETGCHGAQVVADSGQLNGISFGVCAEPTSLQVLVGEKGIFWTKIVSRGQSAHGSRPDEGINAIQACMDAINLMTGEPFPFEADELLGDPTLNVGVIEGGIKVNVVPDRCEAQLDMRLAKGQDSEKLLSEMRTRLESGGLSDRVSVEIIHGKPPVLTPVDSKIVKIARGAVEKVTGTVPSLGTATYGTDCSIIQPAVGILNVICGPGSIEQAHQPDEYILLDELYQSVDVYMNIARHFGS
jgi:succinyl-diaminopimelate desuccinylase